jgi:hypothetical protein
MFGRSFATCFSWLFLLLSGCAAAPESAPDELEDEPADIAQHFDSQDGNPTHATHSYMAEAAIDALRGSYPELQTYRARIVDGANRELHELAVDNGVQELLRRQIGGTNAGCSKPAVLLSLARSSYAAGDKSRAFWLAGIFLHSVQDIGVPSHAFRVVHQSTPGSWDHFEVMVMQKWWPLYSTSNRVDPRFADPTAYIEWSAAWARNDFATAFPGVTYTRTFYPMSWLWASRQHKMFARERQGRTTLATMWALRSIVASWLPARRTR